MFFFSASKPERISVSLKSCLCFWGRAGRRKDMFWALLDYPFSFFPPLNLYFFIVSTHFSLLWWNRNTWQCFSSLRAGVAANRNELHIMTVFRISVSEKSPCLVNFRIPKPRAILMFMLLSCHPNPSIFTELFDWSLAPKFNLAPAGFAKN